MRNTANPYEFQEIPRTLLLQIRHDAQVLGSALLHFGIEPGENTRVGIAGIHSVSDIINKCELKVIFCDNEARAATFIQKINEGVVHGPKKLVILNSSSRQPHGAHESIEGLEVYSYEHMMALGEENLKPPVPPSPSSTYIICFTSGTTGQPKGVQLSHRSLLVAMSGLYIQWVLPPNRFCFSRNDVYFSFLSLAHIYEHLMEAFTIYVGGRIGIYSGDVSRLLTDIKVKIEMLHNGVQRHDTVWDKLVFKRIHKQFGGRLRLLTTGGAPVTPTVMDFTRIAYGCPLMEGYGQTECGAAGTLNLPFDCSSGHVGGPAPWAQVKLVDVPELSYFAAENKGEVCFRGAAVMRGYFMDDELSRKTVDKEGWLHTGDIGEWQINGALKIIERKNAFIKLAQGDFVSPEQIESVYLCSPLIEQIFVSGLAIRSFLVGIAVTNVAVLRRTMSVRHEDVGFPIEKKLTSGVDGRKRLGYANTKASSSRFEATIPEGD
ncbi:unnamed protein product [Angiostrongylus costaricensis]|uniref:long-chain-fatty-acid--CoA ligase n=1 Tax=Angiostrongylus costaricensis TaxID=334426 RepID=A0A0R3PKQ9_ANGCS|nr:unnamed protein product [Angiostrongylus costaricensis]